APGGDGLDPDVPVVSQVSGDGSTANVVDAIPLVGHYEVRPKADTLVHLLFEDPAHLAAGQHFTAFDARRGLSQLVGLAEKGVCLLATGRDREHLLMSGSDLRHPRFHSD